MPGHLKEIGGRAARVVLPVTVTLGLGFAAAHENQDPSYGEQSPDAAGVLANNNLIFGQTLLRFMRKPDALALAENTIVSVVKLPVVKSPVTVKPQAPITNGSELTGALASAEPPAPSAAPPAPVPAPPAPTAYTVQPGDSFSSIAAKESVDIFNLIDDNHEKPWSTIFPGQVLNLPKPGEAPAPAEPLTPPVQAQPAQAESVSAPQTSGGYSASSSSSYTAASSGSYEQCVIYRESRGDATAVNPVSGASGLYGFLDSTWQSVTGLPGKASDYSPAVQQAGFEKLHAESGDSPWASDGCS